MTPTTATFKPAALSGGPADNPEAVWRRKTAELRKRLGRQPDELEVEESITSHDRACPFIFSIEFGEEKCEAAGLWGLDDIWGALLVGELQRAEEEEGDDEQRDENQENQDDYEVEQEQTEFASPSEGSNFRAGLLGSADSGSPSDCTGGARFLQACDEPGQKHLGGERFCGGMQTRIYRQPFSERRAMTINREWRPPGLNERALNKKIAEAGTTREAAELRKYKGQMFGLYGMSRLMPDAESRREDATKARIRTAISALRTKYKCPKLAHHLHDRFFPDPKVPPSTILSSHGLIDWSDVHWDVGLRKEGKRIRQILAINKDSTVYLAWGDQECRLRGRSGFEYLRWFIRETGRDQIGTPMFKVPRDVWTGEPVLWPLLASGKEFFDKYTVMRSHGRRSKWRFPKGGLPWLEAKEINYAVMKIHAELKEVVWTQQEELAKGVVNKKRETRIREAKSSLHHLNKMLDALPAYDQALRRYTAEIELEVKAAIAEVTAVIPEAGKHLAERFVAREGAVGYSDDHIEEPGFADHWRLPTDDHGMNLPVHGERESPTAIGYRWATVKPDDPCADLLKNWLATAKKEPKPPRKPHL